MIKNNVFFILLIIFLSNIINICSKQNLSINNNNYSISNYNFDKEELVKLQNTILNNNENNQFYSSTNINDKKKQFEEEILENNLDLEKENLLLQKKMSNEKKKMNEMQEKINTEKEKVEVEKEKVEVEKQKVLEEQKKIEEEKKQAIKQKQIAKQLELDLQQKEEQRKLEVEKEKKDLKIKEEELKNKEKQIEIDMQNKIKQLETEAKKKEEELKKQIEIEKKTKENLTENLSKNNEEIKNILKENTANLKNDLEEQKEERKILESKIEELKFNQENEFKKLKNINKSFVFKTGTNDSINTIKILEKIENNLTYSDKKKENKNIIEIKKGGWAKRDLIEVEKTKFEIKKTSKKIEGMESKNNNILQKIKNLKESAYQALQDKQYEIAIKFYKSALELNESDNFVKLSLATTYHILHQYSQAKILYLELIDVFPNSEQLAANLLSIMIQESPHEAVYLIPPIAAKHLNSSLIQAQTSMAFATIGKNSEAINYLQKAIILDPNNIDFKYNLAVLFDLTKNFNEAKSLYNEVLTLDPYNSNRNKNIKKRLNKI